MFPYRTYSTRPATTFLDPAPGTRPCSREAVHGSPLAVPHLYALLLGELLQQRFRLVVPAEGQLDHGIVRRLTATTASARFWVCHCDGKSIRNRRSGW